MRHDWNSLLSNDNKLLFTNYSKELFPCADDLQRYFQDFATNYDLAIEYNSRVEHVRKGPDDRFVITIGGEECFTCDRLLMATGPISTRLPTEIEGIELAESYADHELDPDDYIDQRVAIIGRGNSAFEVANHLAGTAAHIHMLVGVPVKHAWQTHYPGDLRAINNTILDMFQLKSLHATLGMRPIKIEMNQKGEYVVTVEEDYPHWETPGTGVNTMTYDRVIYCTGWNFIDHNLFDEGCRPEVCQKSQYPRLDSMWQSTVPNLYFIGTSMAARDKKAASSFIHGFRYNVRTLFKLFENKYYYRALHKNSVLYGAEDDLHALAKIIIERVSNSSGLYQMFGFLCDVLLFDEEQNEVRIMQELPRDHLFELPELNEARDFVAITLEYGFHKYPKSVIALDFIHPSDAARKECAAYLHPVFRHFHDGKVVEELHLGESLSVRYDVYDYEGNFESAHKNTLLNFLNRVRPLNDTLYSEQVYNDGAQIFRPWDEKRLEEMDERRKMTEKPQCKFAS